MKKILAFALFALFTAQALAAVGWVRVDPPSVRWFGKPDFVDLDGVRHWSPTDAQCVEAGWVACEYGGNPADAVLDYSATPPLRDMTQEEMDARAADQAEAQAERDRQAALPTVYTNGVEVPWVVFLDATNRQRGIAMELTTNNVPIYYEFHASPVDWKKVDANRAAALSAAAAKEKDSAEAVAYAKDKAAKDKASKAEAVAATSGGKEPSDKEKIALVWKHYLAVVGAEKE